jgi:hypothetical protein
MYIFMHIFFEEIGAFVSPVSIEDAEVAAAGPSSFEVGFGDVHDDGDAVFIIVLDQSMKGVDCISFDGSIRPFDEFDRLDLGYS